MRAFSVMAKPVGAACNLRCDYCYYLPTPRAAPRMTDAVLERLVAAVIAAGPGPAVSFVWHGGEPTLAGLDFYRRVVELQRTYLPVGWTAWNNLQTNGLLLDDEWCAFLAEARFDVGVSIDGTAWLHDLHRVGPGGEPSYAGAVAAVRRLQAHGVNPDLLCTVTPATATEPLAVYRGLRGLGTGWIQFIPVVIPDGTGRAAPGSVSGAEYGEFLCTVFDEWVRYDLGVVDVQLFAETTRTLAGGAPGLCWLAPVCGRALVVETDGTVYACDHYVRPEYKRGNLMTTALADLVDSPAQVAFGEAKADVPARCQACEWRPYCHGGCPKDRGVDGVNHLCDGLTRFFAYAVPTLNQVIAMSRAGATAAAIRTEILDAARGRWAGVGRNDPCPCGSGRKAKVCCWARRV